DTRPDKRARLVARLLAGPAYVNHFVNVWRALLLPEVSTNFATRLQQQSFEGWLRQQLSQGAGYDRMVRELLTTPVAGAQPFKQPGAMPPSPAGFYLAKELKPENLAAATSRVFLGVRLECAQCHDHPFADWKKDQFWSFAAFFAGLTRQGPGEFAGAGEEF